MRLTQKITILCECGRPDCEDEVTIEFRAYEGAREVDDTYVVVPDHVEAAIERRRVGTTASYVVVEAPRPERHSFKAETLRLQHDSLLSEVASLKEDVNSLLSQITTSGASAALVLSVFGAVRPASDDTLISVLFAVALIPFGVLVLLALLAPERSRAVEEATDPSTTMAEQRKHKADPPNRRLSIMSYEQAARRRALIEKATRYDLPEVLLPEADWLILELDRLLRRRDGLKKLRRRTRRKRAQVVCLLGVLVVYLGVVAFLATLR